MHDIWSTCHGLRERGGESAEPFVTTNGLKQGSVLSPILFNIFFGTIIHAARAEWKAKELGIKLTTRPANR